MDGSGPVYPQDFGTGYPGIKATAWVATHIAAGLAANPEFARDIKERERLVQTAVEIARQLLRKVP